MQVSNLLEVQYSYHVVQDSFDCIVILNLRKNRLFKFNTSDLQPFLLRALEFFAGVRGGIFVGD